MAMPNQGGVCRPKVYTAIPTTGSEVDFTGETNYLEVRNTGGVVLRLFFERKADFTTSTDFIPIAITTGVWVGPVKTRKIWLVSASATTSAIVIPFFTP